MVQFEQRIPAVVQRARLYRLMSSGVEVSVTPESFGPAGGAESREYSFSYSIQIQNHRDDTIQLMARRWTIFSGGELFGEVTGLGVVGVQPVLNPGETFEYSSGAVIEDPVGRMFGEYVFVDRNGGPFSVTIPEFSLTYEAEVH